MVSRIVGIIALGMFVVAGSAAYAGVDPGDLCKDAKAKAAGKKAMDLFKALGKNEKKSDVSKLGFDISKAQSKFAKAFTKAETGTCQTTGDVGTVEAKVDAFVAEIRNDLSGFVDNGDGTITDPNIGLMWEQKDDAGGIHDVDNDYSWAGCCDGSCSTYDNYCQPNAAAAAACSAQTGGAVGCSECSVGTCDVDPYDLGAISTIWDWLVQVNAEGGTGFAGYSDWRVPSEEGCNSCLEDGQCPCDPAELESILLEPYRSGTSPCIDPIFGLTASYYYWTGSTHASYPYRAWAVNFGDCGLYYGYKYNDARVRAVRGGSPSAAFLDLNTGVLD